MAYDIELQTPKGKLGLNFGYSTGAADMIVQGFVDGVSKGIISACEFSGPPGLVLLECLKDMGKLPADATTASVTAYLAATPQEEAVKPIIAWFKRNALAGWVAFANRILGISATGPAPQPGGATFFQSPEHGLRAGFKATILFWDPVNNVVTGDLP